MVHTRDKDHGIKRPGESSGKFAAAGHDEAEPLGADDAPAAPTAKEMTHYLKQFIAANPGSTVALLETTRKIIARTPAPAVTAQRIDDPDWGWVSKLIDPYNGRSTRLIAVDTAVRHTEANEDIDFKGESVAFDYTSGDGHFEAVTYLSTASGKRVSLPQGWSEQ